MYVKNTASQHLPFCLVNASTGAALTGATVTAKRCLDGAAQASCTGTVSETAGGQYDMAFSQADTNADTGGYLFTATSAIPVQITIAFFAAANLPANATQFAGQTITAAAGVTLPSSVASPTNITAGTMTTTTNLTNAPTNGDFTAAMKTSLNAATPASVVGAVGSVTGNVGGNVTGSVGSVLSAVTIAAGQLFIKKNTQITITFPMTDATTHLPATGLTVAAKRTIDGAAVGNCANSVTELSVGLYSLVLAAADVNGTQITLALSATGADTRWIGLVTQA